MSPKLDAIKAVSQTCCLAENVKLKLIDAITNDRVMPFRVLEAIKEYEVAIGTLIALGE